MCKTLEGREIIPESRNASVHRTVLFCSHLKSGKFPGIQISCTGPLVSNLDKKDTDEDSDVEFISISTNKVSTLESTSTRADGRIWK